MTDFILHLGEEPTRYSDERGKPYVRPQYHYRVTEGRGEVLCGFCASPETEVARMLIAQKIAAPSHSLEVRRGGRVVFRTRPVGKWAGLTVREDDTKSACFVPYRERVTA
ncbi:hypothetical protein [Ovoidimarina sediminis]|uniref:hypothetical protein n=1 Tax=Ovoidimarina sediminis TaxID=3079856 RepID=UPI00290BDB17|nr:hypothetical protein [Rhodophyticola sp. MJ-SS7]MDU8946644.1 hypothetical protein [Rhodophyticola sp. MJ-SS7]